MRKAADGLMGGLARILVHVFFRRIEVERASSFPPGVPIVLVANHTNGLVDALLLMTAVGRHPRFLGKSTLFKIAPMWPFLKLAGVVPVYRAKDGESTARNAGAFAMCRQLLAAGGMVALFPEGISHDEATLQPLRTGAARIALGASVEDGVTDVITVAVGLSYDAKARFRSRALVRVGEPQAVAPWADSYRHDARQAVRALTADLAERLVAVSPDYRSWMEAETLGGIADVVARPMGPVPAEVDLAERERLARTLADGATSLATLRDAYERYQRDLTLLGLDDAQVCARSRHGQLRLMLAWSAAKAVAASPIALVGAVVHVLPYQAMKRVGRIPSSEGMRATVKLLGCFASFTLLYIGLGVLAGTQIGPLGGVGAFVAAPACGYVAVRFSERVKRLGGAVAGARAVRARGGAVDSVLANRRTVVDLATSVLRGSAV